MESLWAAGDSPTIGRPTPAQDSLRSRFDFVQVSSAYYPLADYYVKRAQERLRRAQNPALTAVELAALEAAWRAADDSRRASLREFLTAHGYGIGQFRMLGGVHYELVLRLLGGGRL